MATIDKKEMSGLKPEEEKKVSSADMDEREPQVVAREAFINDPWCQDGHRILFSFRNLKKYFPLKKKAFEHRQYYVHANENISINIYEGETLGMVGESGSGKSTFGRTLLQLYPQTEGMSLYYGSSLAEVNPKYVHEDLKKLPKLYPEYLKESEEYRQMEEKADSLDKDKNPEEWHDIQDEMMKERRRLQNRYFSILYLAGGLLLDDDLNAVSQLLIAQQDARAELAAARRGIKDINWKLSIDDWKDEWDKLKGEKKALEAKLPDLKQKAEEARQRVEDRRLLNKDKEGFSELEDQRDEGVDLSRLTNKEMRDLRKDMQIIFQDPYSSLDPRMTLGNIIGEGLMAHQMFKSRHSAGYNQYIQDTMEQAGLDPYFIHRYPHQFSGGQRQRIGIARALALQPTFIVCDEAVSALDVSIQSQILNLLKDLKKDNDLTYLFITHDLSVEKYISDRIVVMYLGHLMELADSQLLFDHPLHPYSQALLAAIPRTDVDSRQELALLEGDIPSAVNPPSGCCFHTRCRYCMDRCQRNEPVFQQVEPRHYVACHLMDMDEEERKKWMAECDKKYEERKAKLDEKSAKVSHLIEEEIH